MNELLGWWQSISFTSPWAFALLLVLPVWWWMRARRRPPAIVFSRAGSLASGSVGRNWTTRLAVVLRTLAIAALVLALARPRAGVREEQLLSDGIDIMIALDISSSMLAEDFQPENRLAVAKDRIKEFILGRVGDRIGLIAFAGEALTQVPLAVDYPVLLQATDNIDAGMLEDGTDRKSVV